MGIFDTIASGLFRRADPISDAAGVAAFMDARTAFMAQKCVVEFCRVRAGVYWQKLFSEAEFKRALDTARWRSYPPVFAMVAEMVEGAMREAAGLRQRRLPDALGGLAATVFEKYRVPDGEAGDFWLKAGALVRERLDATQSGPPRPVREMPEPMARAVFDALPLHKDIVTNDYDYIFNNLRMNLLRAHEDFLSTGRLSEIADDLLGR